jgi:Zn-dependent M28 family amino/carboxypeptidase
MAEFSGISKNLTGLALTLLFSAGCSTVEPIHKIADPDFAENVSPLLNKFVESSAPNRTVGSKGHEQAFEFIKNQFDEIATAAKGRVIIHEFIPDIDFAKKSYQSDFDTLVKPKYPPSSPIYKKWKIFTDQAIAFVERFRNIKGRNIILEIPGRRNPAEVVYVGAHYDTIDNDHASLRFMPFSPAPGADDNASGITALLVAARELRNEHPDRTIRFVAFDYEEIFFLGSYALAKDLSSLKPRWMRLNEQTGGLFNLEMIAWSKTKIENHPVVKLYTREKRRAGADLDVSLALTLNKAGFLLKTPLNLVLLQNGFNRSDNWSFWQRSFPAVCISEDWEKDFNESHYHTSTDTPDTLNYDYLKEITKVLVETLSETTRLTSSR